ncbi:MAG: fimbrillin family protein [Prevotella sp.]|nr:fimbrillin family protein [Prevotella sp.]
MHILSRHILTRFPLLMLLLTLGACSSDNGDAPQPESRPTAIAFAPKVGDEATRAGITYTGNDINTLNKSGFGVFCYYSGTSNYASATAPQAQDVVMNNVKVSRPDGSTENWQYDPKRFWPSAGNKLSFFAYAPYMGEASVKTGAVPETTYSSDGVNGNKMKLTSYVDNGVYYPAINYYATATLADQNDLLWGTDDRGVPFANADIAKYPNGYIYFQMCHALARLQLYITSTENYSANPVGNPPSGWRYNTSETRLFVKSVTIANQYGQGTLVLNNTEAFIPRWVNKTGTGGTDGQWLSFDLTGNLKHVIDGTLTDDHLKADWDNHAGVTKDTTGLLTNNAGVLVIPKLREDLSDKMPHTSFTVVSQRVTKWTNSQTGEERIVRGDELSRTATLKDGQDLLGGHSYRVNLNILAKYLELTLLVQPWTLDETVFTDVNKPVTITVPSDRKITWLQTEDYGIDDRDSLAKGLVYINSHHASATFQITAPLGATWSASLVPVSGRDNAFVFTDDKGNIIGTPSGKVGTGDDHMGRIYLRAANLTTSVENRALLRFYVKTAGGQTAIVRNLVPENNGKFTEYQLVQRINQ